MVSGAAAAVPADLPLGNAFDAVAGTDSWSRQRAVILAFSRRSIAQTGADSLIHDAAALVAETLQAPCFCSAHLSDDGTALPLKFTRVGGTSAEVSLPRTASFAIESFAGHALSSARPLIFENLAKDERCKDVFLRNQGVVSGLLMPLLVADVGFGALGVFFAAEHKFSAADVEFAETIGHMLAGTLGRIQAEVGWRNERQLASSLFHDIDNLVIMTNLQGHVQRINRACEEVTGYTSQELRGRMVWSTFASPEDAPQAHIRLREGISHGKSTRFDLTMLTKHAAQRPVHWTQTVLVRRLRPSAIRAIFRLFTARARRRLGVDRGTKSATNKNNASWSNKSSRPMATRSRPSTNQRHSRRLPHPASMGRAAAHDEPIPIGN